VKTTRYHILLALAREPIHGAEIRRRVEEDSGGAVKLYPAMLYGSLDDLTGAGWISEVPGEEQPGETNRWRFYELTAEGRRALESETARLAEVVHRAQASLGGTG
jgi:DNA-binding PadR family transcriptional regulator